jgi:hypothetical protein
MPLTPAQVATWTKEPEGEVVTSVTQAVNIYVAALPVVQHLTTGQDWPADVMLGAKLLAARLIRRRNSPNGVEALTDAGVTYVARYDSDISRLLHLDAAQKPAVG